MNIGEVRELEAALLYWWNSWKGDFSPMQATKPDYIKFIGMSDKSICYEKMCVDRNAEGRVMFSVGRGAVALDEIDWVKKK